MKNLLKNSVIAILIVVIALTVVACGVDETETPHTHQYTEQITKAASCTENGEKTFTCTCSDSYTEEIPAKEHADTNKDHVCDNECGVAQGTHAEQTNSHTCAYCGEVAGTCRDGDNDHDCDVCGAAQGTHAEQTNSHTCAYCGEAAGTCRDGDNDHDCDVCGIKLSECKAGTPVQENSTAAACGKPGSYDEVTYCTICGDELKREHKTTEALPHAYEVTSTTEATCENAGSKTLVCSACGDTKTEEIAALGHNEISVAAQAPTCTAIGWDAYVKCSRCDYTTYKELPVTSHNYNEVVTAPTCLEGGYTTYTCSGCSKSYTGNVTEPKGHKETAVVTSPDCENGGFTTYTCSSCGNVRTGDETEKLGHKEEIVKGKEATCTEAGVSDGKKCSVCHVTLEEQKEIPAPGHEYDVTVKDATCTEEGLKTFDCQNCDDTYTEVIPASGSHSFTDSFICDNCGFDSTPYRLENGGFENGLEGWTLVGNIGNVSSDAHYWINDPERAEGYAFGMDGVNMFSAYAPGNEERLVGTLTSSTFKVGGSGFVTFKVGAMKDGNYVYVDVVDAETKQILARYYNGLWAERTDGVKSGCTLIAYKADLSAFMGKEVFFRISDNADSGYGLFFADSFITYYQNEPEGFNVATPVNYTVSGTIYDVFNGGFEMGDVQGWWNIGEIGVVTNATGYWGDNIPYGKVGDYLFTGVESFGADTMREGNRGTLTSSVFEIGGSGWISFMLGGGADALCYVQVIDAVTGEVLARYHQQAQQDAKLIQYIADLSAYIGRTARIQVVDQAGSGNWGCVSFDNVVTYYPDGVTFPEGVVIANDIKYELANGSFENGLDGWTMNITEAGSKNTLGWIQDSEREEGWYHVNTDRKDGNNLFTFLALDGANCESSKGTLNSSTFVLKQNSFVSFRFGAAGTRDVNIQLCKANGEVIATFYNEAPDKVDTLMYAYYYQYTGETTECFFKVVDDSTSNYGCFVVDDFRVNLESAPEGFIPAIQ